MGGGGEEGFWVGLSLLGSRTIPVSVFHTSALFFLASKEARSKSQRSLRVSAQVLLCLSYQLPGIAHHSLVADKWPEHTLCVVYVADDLIVSPSQVWGRNHTAKLTTPVSPMSGTS